MSSAENIGFSRKDWPLWILIYLIISLFYNLAWAVWNWKNFFIFGSIFISAVVGLHLAKKYVGCQKVIGRCVFGGIVLMFLVAPIWFQAQGGSIAHMDWHDYVENIVFAFLFFQYFIGAFYALLFLPFLWFLTKYRYKEYSGGEKRKVRIFDIGYWSLMVIWPMLIIAFLYDYR